MNAIAQIKSHPILKKIALWMLQNPYRPRPRWWVKTLWNPFVHHFGKRSRVSDNTRMDVFPFRKFELGQFSTVEDFSCINNAMGDVTIGQKSRVGIGNTVIGPVQIGDNVNMAQNVVLSGLNHGYEDIHIPPREQACSIGQITIEDDCWIGANAVITAGVTVGKHSVVAGGSVVTKDVPPYSVVGGNPAKILKKYDPKTNIWQKPQAA